LSLLRYNGVCLRTIRATSPRVPLLVKLVPTNRVAGGVPLLNCVNQAMPPDLRWVLSAWGQSGSTKDVLIVLTLLIVASAEPSTLIVFGAKLLLSVLPTAPSLVALLRRPVPVTFMVHALSAHTMVLAVGVLKPRSV